MRKGKVELHIEWDDDCTVEIRYFDTKKEAKAYAAGHGIPRSNYTIYG